MQHTCKECGETKDVREFRRNTKHAGYEPWNLRKCKVCVHSDYTKRMCDPEKREAMLESSRKYRKSNPEKHVAHAQLYRERHKDKIRSTSKLRYAVKMGRIERKPCELCSSTVKIHGHHDSYAEGEELNVRWLCGDHHVLWHRILDTMDERADLDSKFKSFLQSVRSAN